MYTYIHIYIYVHIYMYIKKLLDRQNQERFSYKKIPKKCFDYICLSMIFIDSVL